MKKTDYPGNNLYKFRKTITAYSFVIPAFTFLIIFMAYPVLYNITMSLKNINISNLISGDAEFVGLKNFIVTLQDPFFYRSSINTFVFMVLSLFFQFVFGMILALYFNQKFAGTKWMRSVILVGWMNPIIITASVFKWLLSGDSGVVNYLLMQLGIISEPIMFLANPTSGLLSLVIANIWIGIPFNMILLLTGMQGLPEDVYEAASIDGAGKISRFFHITMPLLGPTITTLLMLGVIYTFKVFDLIFIMTKGGPARATQTIPYYSYEISFRNYRFGQGAAVSVIIFIIILTLSMFYLRTTQKGSDL